MRSWPANLLRRRSFLIRRAMELAIPYYHLKVSRLFTPVKNDGRPLPAGGITRMDDKEELPARGRRRKRMKGAEMGIREIGSRLIGYFHPNQDGFGQSGTTSTGLFGCYTTYQSKTKPPGNTVLQARQTRPTLPEYRAKGGPFGPIGSNVASKAPELTSNEERDFTYGHHSDEFHRRAILDNETYFPIKIPADKDVLQREIDKVPLWPEGDDLVKG
jgi:hypothetical protein